MLQYSLSTEAKDVIGKNLSSGGFTFSLKDGLVNRGFAVSIFPELERRYTSPHNDWYRWTPEIERYMNKYIKFLSNPRVCLGGWWVYGDDDYNEGYSFYLDVVVICPNERSAVYLSRKYHQVAYYDLAHRQEFKVPVSTTDLLDRMNDIPEVKTWKLYHPTRNYPACVMNGKFKGPHNVGEPGVLFYEKHIEADSKPYAAYIERDLAIADVKDPALISRIPLTMHAETALVLMGYDGYKSDGKVFLFGDIRIDEVRRYA